MSHSIQANIHCYQGHGVGVRATIIWRNQLRHPIELTWHKTVCVCHAIFFLNGLSTHLSHLDERVLRVERMTQRDREVWLRTSINRMDRCTYVVSIFSVDVSNEIRADGDLKTKSKRRWHCERAEQSAASSRPRADMEQHYDLTLKIRWKSCIKITNAK